MFKKSLQAEITMPQVDILYKRNDGEFTSMKCCQMPNKLLNITHRLYPTNHLT